MNYKNTHDLLDDLGRGVEVDEALVHLELVAVPGLGTFTARLARDGLRKPSLFTGAQQ